MKIKTEINMYICKNNHVLHIYYNTSKNIVNYLKTEIDNKNIKELSHNTIIKKSKKLGLNNTDITNLLNIKDFGCINPEDAILYLDRPHKHKNMLSEISYNFYKKIPDEKQKLYNKYYIEDYKLKDTFEFINHLMHKYKNYIIKHQLEMKIDILSSNPCNLSRVCFSLMPKHPMKFDILKYYAHKYLMHALVMPITELGEDFTENFVEFDEERFIKGLLPGTKDNIQNNECVYYHFKLSDNILNKIDNVFEKLAENPLYKLTKKESKLIKTPIYIDLTEYKKIDNYEYCSQFTSLTEEYRNLMLSATPKNITFDDVLYLMQFINNIMK